MPIGELEPPSASPVQLLYFWAHWCGPCKMSGLALRQFARRRNDLVVTLVHVDEQPNLVVRFAVETIPTIILIADGEIRWRWSGTFRASQLDRVVNRVLAEKTPISRECNDRPVEIRESGGSEEAHDARNPVGGVR